MKVNSTLPSKEHKNSLLDFHRINVYILRKFVIKLIRITKPNTTMTQGFNSRTDPQVIILYYIVLCKAKGKKNNRVLYKQSHKNPPQNYIIKH